MNTVHKFHLPVALFVAALSWALLTGSASAHAKFEKSEPAPDSALTVAPKQVTIWFKEELDTRKSSIKVFNAAGAQVDNGDSKVNLNERKQMSVTLKQPLPNGVYTVKWSNVSAEDGDPSEGEFKFTVQAPTTPTVAPTSAPTIAPATATPAPTATPLPPTPVPPTPTIPAPAATPTRIAPLPTLAPAPTNSAADFTAPLVVLSVVVLGAGAFLVLRKK